MPSENKTKPENRDETQEGGTEGTASVPRPPVSARDNVVLTLKIIVSIVVFVLVLWGMDRLAGGR